MSTKVAMPDRDAHEDVDLDHFLDDARTVNAENWKGHENQINRIFSLYRDKVNPLISVYNSL